MARKVPRTQRGVPRTQRAATHYNTRQDIVPAEKVYAEEAREVPQMQHGTTERNIL